MSSGPCQGFHTGSPLSLTSVRSLLTSDPGVGSLLLLCHSGGTVPNTETQIRAVARARYAASSTRGGSVSTGATLGASWSFGLEAVPAAQPSELLRLGPCGRSAHMFAQVQFTQCCQLHGLSFCGASRRFWSFGLSGREAQLDPGESQMYVIPHMWMSCHNNIR